MDQDHLFEDENFDESLENDPEYTSRLKRLQTEMIEIVRNAGGVMELIKLLDQIDGGEGANDGDAFSVLLDAAPPELSVDFVTGSVTYEKQTTAEESIGEPVSALVKEVLKSAGAERIGVREFYNHPSLAEYTHSQIDDALNREFDNGNVGLRDAATKLEWLGVVVTKLDQSDIHAIQ